jgi:heme exporter protein D
MEFFDLYAYGVPVWIAVAVILLAILLTIAGLAYVVLTEKPPDGL